MGLNHAFSVPFLVFCQPPGPTVWCFVYVWGCIFARASSVFTFWVRGSGCSRTKPYDLYSLLAHVHRRGLYYFLRLCFYDLNGVDWLRSSPAICTSWPLLFPLTLYSPFEPFEVVNEKLSCPFTSSSGSKGLYTVNWYR